MANDTQTVNALLLPRHEVCLQADGHTLRLLESGFVSEFPSTRRPEIFQLRAVPLTLPEAFMRSSLPFGLWELLVSCGLVSSMII